MHLLSTSTDIAKTYISLVKFGHLHVPYGFVSNVILCVRSDLCDQILSFKNMHGYIKLTHK